MFVRRWCWHLNYSFFANENYAPRTRVNRETHNQIWPSSNESWTQLDKPSLSWHASMFDMRDECQRVATHLILSHGDVLHSSRPSLISIRMQGERARLLTSRRYLNASQLHSTYGAKHHHHHQWCHRMPCRTSTCAYRLSASVSFVSVWHWQWWSLCRSLKCDILHSCQYWEER